MIVYGAVIPSLLEYQQWSLDPAQAGIIGSYALIGMLIGTLLVGTITDIVGRRKIMLFCISWFSVFMGLSALAPSAEIFGILRFLTGVGLGGVIPTAIALTVEYAPSGRRNFANALMFSGWGGGGVLAALLAIPLIPAFGWQFMFWLGLLPLFTIVPAAYFLLPESVSFLLANGRRQEAEELARTYNVSIEEMEASSSNQVEGDASGQASKTAALRSLFSKNYLVATLLFWAASFVGLLLIYALNTWLPQIMVEAGYPLGSSLAFLLALNIGAIVGVIIASTFADRFGPKPVATLSFLAAAVCISLLSFQLPALILYALVAVAGLGTIGTQILINSYVATHYPSRSSATAVGWSLGIGRLGAIVGPPLGGFILASQLGFEWNFYTFAILALIGSLLIFLVPRAPVAGAVPSTAAKETRTASST